MQLHRARKDREAAGLKLVFIGQATPRHAAHFRQRMEFDAPVLADEKRQTYKLIGAKHGNVNQLIGPKVVAKGVLTARKYGVSRKQMDEFGVMSHQRAHEATDKGYMRSQILSVDVPVNGHTDVFDKDEGIRANATYEAAAALQPAFNPEHSITAGNSSQITDGAAAVLLMEKQKALELGLTPRARVIAQKVVGVDPILMLEGPIPATAAVLKQAGLELKDIDLFEVNEAFASVPLAWLKETGADPAKLNVNGGAIAIATGSRPCAAAAGSAPRRSSTAWSNEHLHSARDAAADRPRGRSCGARPERRASHDGGGRPGAQRRRRGAPARKRAARLHRPWVDHHANRERGPGAARRRHLRHPQRRRARRGGRP